MKGYELFHRTLQELNLHTIFGNPGSTEIPMLRGAGDYILTLHDSISVGMADGYAQYSGHPAIVNLHTLPGVANSMAFIHTARMNHSPVIITSGQQDNRHAFYEPLLWHNLSDLVGNAAKYRYEVKSASDIERALKRAYSISLAPPAGPVFLSFPMDIMDEIDEYHDFPFSEPNREIIDMEAVRRIADLIAGSSNPVIIAGSEIDELDGYSEVDALARILGIPVYAEPLGSRATFRSESTSFAGDLPPATTAINLSLLKYDFILNLGGDFTLYPYLPSPLLPGKRIITVSLTPTYRFGECILSNPRIFAKELSKLVKGKWSFTKLEESGLNSVLARERRTMGLNYVLNKAKSKFKGYVIVDEAISSSLQVRKIIGYEPKSYFTAKSGQLGWGMPAAAGISMRSPNVLEIVGDGSFMYTVQTLWTIANYKLPVKILVLNNEGYSILKSFSSSYYPSVEKAPYLTFQNDLAKISQSFGIDARKGDPELSEMGWLAEGDVAKVLVVDLPKSVPKLFP